MRTRARFDTRTVFWIIPAVAQIGLAIARMDRNIPRGRTGWVVLDSFSLLLWLFILIIYILQPVLGFWQVDSAGVCFRRFWKMTEIPFGAIVAVRDPPATKRHPPSTLEIEVAPRGMSLYPHNYLSANPADRDGFLHAIATYAPQLLTQA